MKSVVLYKSKTGFTKEYAHWISTELSSDIFDVSDITIEMLIDYDVIIYGGGLYSSHINGVKFITNHIDQLSKKKIIVFATGISPFSDEVLKDVKSKNFKDKMLDNIEFFYFRGGFDYSTLKNMDKFLMSLLRFRLKHKKHLSDEEKEMLGIYDKPVDFGSKENIEDLLTSINS